MTYNDKIKQLLDNIISELANNKDKYVLNPGKDFSRNRKLPFEIVIKLILSMKGGSLHKELYDFFGRDPEAICSSSAFIQQRDKLTEQLFIDLFYAFANTLTDGETYKGYRLFAVDGSDINVAYDKDADTYIKPAIKTKKDGTEGKGHNQIHLNAIYDLINKEYVDVLLQPRQKSNERAALITMLENMDCNHKTLFIADRGYPSWNLFAHFKYKENADYLIRVTNTGNTIAKDLPMEELDIDVSTTISTKSTDYGKAGYTYIPTKKNKMSNRAYTGKTVFPDWDFGQYEDLTIRVVRFKITDTTYETIFTSLPREQFSIDEIKKLYAMRWGIETSFRELKYVICLSTLHSKKDALVKQEIFAKLIMYNFTERIIAHAVVEQDDNRKYEYRINYTMAMKICLDFYRGLVDTMNVYTLMLKYIEAYRPGREDKRKRSPAPKYFVFFMYRVAA